MRIVKAAKTASLGLTTANQYLEAMVNTIDAYSENGTDPEDALMFMAWPDEDDTFLISPDGSIAHTVLPGYGTPEYEEKHCVISPDEDEEFWMGFDLIKMILRYRKGYKTHSAETITKHALSMAEKGYALPAPLLKMLCLVHLNSGGEGRPLKEREPHRKRLREESTIIKAYHLLLAGGEHYFGLAAKTKTNIVGHCCTLVKGNTKKEGKEPSDLSPGKVNEILKKYKKTLERPPGTWSGEHALFVDLQKQGARIGKWFEEAVKLDRHNIKKLPLPGQSFWTFQFGEVTPDSLKRLHDFLKEQKTI